MHWLTRKSIFSVQSFASICGIRGPALWLTGTLIAFVSLMSTAVVLAAPETVGNLGDPERILFVGNDTFESRQIRSALGFNLDVLLASHPDAPLDDLLPLLEHRVRDGYRNVGFAEATVTAKYVEKRSAIVVSIVEGPRLTCGNVEIIGATSIPVDRLRAKLTAVNVQYTAATPQSPSVPKVDDALWQVGKPASLATGHWQSKSDAFKKVFHSLGYFDSTFTVKTRPEADGTATLVVTIQDEGPRAVLGEIEVYGGQKNSAEDVIKYLALPPGLVLDSDQKSRIEKKLSNAARFLKHDVEIISPPFGDEPSILRIKLVEYPDAPPLSEPLSAEEEVMVRLARWISDLETADDDVDLRFVGPLTGNGEDEPKVGTLVAHIQLVISNREQGGLCHVRIVQHPDHELFDAWTHLTPKSVELYSPKHALKYEAKETLQCVIGSIAWNSHPPDAQGRMSSVHFGLGARGNSDHQLPPFVLNVTAAPVVALREAHKNRDDLKLKNGVLSIDLPKYQLAVASDTGRLMKLVMDNGPHLQFQAHCEPGRYRKILADYVQQSAGARRIEAGGVPISNLLSFLATCLPDQIHSTGTRSSEKLTALVHALLKRGAFHAFDNLLLDYMNGPDDVFSIPPEPNLNKKLPPLGWTLIILPVARLVVPNPSWPWTISREFVFAMSRRSQHSGKSIKGLLADQKTGPMANLASAWVFGMISPPMKGEFARLGLTRLKREHFQADYEPFLTDRSPIGRLLLATAQTLQEVDTAEMDLIADQVPFDESDRRALSRALQLFPEHRNDRPIDALRAAFDEAWEPLIEPRVRALLNALAN